MSIVYQEREKLLTLHTRHTTYQMSVDEVGFLRHLYYGPRAEGADFRCLLLSYDRGFSSNPYEKREDRSFSTDTMPQEYTGAGLGDHRVQSVAARNADGSMGVDFRYVGHTIRRGKYALPGLPAAFETEEYGAETLEVTLQDRVTGLGVRLLYGVFEDRDVITRAAELFNGGTGRITLEKAASMCLDMPFGPWELIHFHGRHCMERMPERVPLGHDIHVLQSKRGMSSHQHNPFAILCAPGTGEDAGSCYGMMLAWSGSHKTEIEVDYLGSTRTVMGIQDDRFQWGLEPGESFFTPEVLMVYTDRGFGTLSHLYHDFLHHHICRGKFALARRPILLNSWEAAYFDFNTEKLLDIARQAADLGVEMLVMDDGWFGNRDTDNSGLGDWYVNENKLPGGMDPLIEGVNALGMQFGIWLEPEMVNEDSDLFRTHPDWAMRMPGRNPVMGRNQMVLDMSREDVREYLYGCIAGLLRKHRIDYIKWDMNRPIADIYSNALPPERQGEVGHRYMLGLYALLERLTSEFPDVLFEGCSGGGGRFDAGMLYYTPQIWCSDDTDAMERLEIQYGTSFGYPVSTMGAHVSACPNHQTGRTTDLDVRGIVAMSGTFGYELDPGHLSDGEKEEVRHQIAAFKKYRDLIQFGIYDRLDAPPGLGRGSGMDGRPFTAWQFTARDGSEALVSLVTGWCQPNSPPVHVRMKSLDPAALYHLEGETRTFPGAALMYGGYTVPGLWGDAAGTQLHFIRAD